MYLDNPVVKCPALEMARFCSTHRHFSPAVVAVQAHTSAGATKVASAQRLWTGL